ncbi:MAG: ThuA domain-containing protein [Opitutaceae bacterium]|jgi:type 1 glutamine amidotransferase|nr:ThuA domain-containing protein [Opitutaceae bacterium]
MLKNEGKTQAPARRFRFAWVLAAMALPAAPVLQAGAEAPQSKIEFRAEREACHPKSKILRVMLLSGANNHNWRLTTPELCAVLRESGRFRVDVAGEVAALQPADFASCDVIVSNYNTFKNPVPVDAVWGAAVRAAFLDRIREGGGFVAVHAGGSSFHEWPEYQQLCATSWTRGTTRHGRRHAAPVSFADAAHPVTRGLEPFWTYDEFWENLVVQPGAVALATVKTNAAHGGGGAPGPIVFATAFGRGRGFCLLLGHDVPAMRNPGFRTLLKRGTEWAATGRVTIAPDAPWPATEAAAIAVAQAASGAATLK